MGAPRDRPQVKMMLTCMMEAFRKAGLKPLAMAAVLIEDNEPKTHLLGVRTTDYGSRKRATRWISDSLRQAVHQLEASTEGSGPPPDD